MLALQLVSIKPIMIALVVGAGAMIDADQESPLNKVFAGFAAFCVLQLPVASADPREDAAYIASQIQSDDVLDAQMEAVGDLMVPLILDEFRKSGVELSRQSTIMFSEIFLEEMSKVFKEGMREAYATAALKNSTPEVLADFRTFLESESGQEWAAVQGPLLRDLTKLAETVGMDAGLNSIPPVLERLKGPEGNAFDEADLAELIGIFE